MFKRFYGVATAKAIMLHLFLCLVDCVCVCGGGGVNPRGTTAVTAGRGINQINRGR